MTKQELYERNRKRSKILSVSAPFVFWGLIILSVLFLAVALRNSAGNMNEITSMLDSKKFTGEELRANYAYLTDKYGEWIIGNGSTGFQLTFVNVKNAVFGGFAIAMGVSAVLCFIGAFVLGKWLFPMLSKKIIQDNQDMVNLTILKNDDER